MQTRMELKGRTAELVNLESENTWEDGGKQGQFKNFNLCLFQDCWALSCGDQAMTC
jgi:hypothetical protein